MKYYLIFNPAAKNGRNKSLLDTIIRIFSDKHLHCDYTVTRRLEDACHFSAQANRKGYDCIIAAGGDGTINRVINGFYDQQGRRISKAALGIIHTGTSPDFCKSYNIPTLLPAAIECIIKGNKKSVRIGQVKLAKSWMPEYHNMPVDDNDQFVTRYFGCCANIGLGASLARFANQGIRKYLGDFSGTFVSVLKTLMQYKAADQLIALDNRSFPVENLYNLAVGITYYIASGIKVYNNLQENEDRFYTLILKNLTAGKIPMCIKTIYSGKPVKDNDCFSFHYGRVIEIYGNNGNPEVEFDGDPNGFLPCRIQIAGDSLEVFSKGVHDE
jgi:diacylglycerol kinase family enzyme